MRATKTNNTEIILTIMTNELWALQYIHYHHENQPTKIGNNMKPPSSRASTQLPLWSL